MNIKEKMTIGKAKKILRGFLSKDCYYDTPLYYAIPYILEYINELQQELQRKDNIIKSLINYLETQINDYKEMGYNQSKIREKDLWMAGQYDEDIFILDKIKELENGNK